MEHEKKYDPATPPPPYASAPYQPDSGAQYYQPHPQHQYPVGPYSPQQGPLHPGGGYHQQAGNYFVHPGGQYQYQQQQQQPPSSSAVGVQVQVQQPVVYSYVSMIGAIVLSCFVFWCCGIIFGTVAFILALIGQGYSSDGNTVGAIRLRNASYAVSIVGLVIGVILIVLMFVLGMSNSRRYYH